MGPTPFFEMKERINLMTRNEAALEALPLSTTVNISDAGLAYIDKLRLKK